MFTIWHYLFEYIKINYFAAVLVLVLLLLSLAKYVITFRSVNFKWALVFILVLGISLRLFWLAFSSHQPDRSWEEAKNQGQEIDLINIHAIELTKGIWFENPDGTPSARRPIGYPVFLGLFYKLFGAKIEVAWVAHLFLYLITSYFVFLIGRHIFNDRVGILAVFLFSIYPISIYAINMTTDEHLFLPLWYFGIFILFKDIKGIRIPCRWLWYGLIFGYAAMTRTHAIFMPFVIAIADFVKKINLRRIFVQFVLVAFIMQLTNLPWIIRNYKVFGVPILYAATSCFVYSHFNSTADPEWGGHIPEKGEEGYSPALEDALRSGSVKANQMCNQEIIRWIADHPKEFIVLGISRLLSFMNWNRAGGVWPLWYQFYEGAYDPARPLNPKLKKCLEEAAFIMYYSVFWGWIFSIMLMGKRWNSFSNDAKISILIAGSCFMFWFLEHMIIYPDRKYRFPLEPLMIIMATYFFDYILVTFRWENLFKAFKLHLKTRPFGKSYE